MAKYKNIKKMCDGYKFDSSVEMKYYEKLKDDKAKGLILNFELQPRFELQPKYKNKDKTIRAIVYMADFQVYYKGLWTEVIDVKGMATPEAKLKRKMFNYKYPIPLNWIVWNKGLWRDFDEVAKERLKAKKLKGDKLND